jgi:hypothetical protein
MRALVPFACACAAALLASLAEPHARPREVAVQPAWPTHFEGRPLDALPLTAREARLGSGFSGALARFTDGENQLVLRWLEGTPRGYHGAIDCYRGLGFRIEPLPERTDSEGNTWSAFRALRGTEHLRVEERVSSLDGRRHWTSPAQWFWSAALGGFQGPAIGWLVVSPLTES